MFIVSSEINGPIISVAGRMPEAAGKTRVTTARHNRTPTRPALPITGETHPRLAGTNQAIGSAPKLESQST
ncbi:unnamed protein product, partial [Iphiclides podalirius]